MAAQFEDDEELSAGVLATGPEIAQDEVCLAKT